MDLFKILNDLQNCSCGREHTMELKALYIESGLINKIGEILNKNNFPKKILLVSDNNELHACRGIFDILMDSGFSIKARIFPNLRVAEMDDVCELEKLSEDCDGILSIGTGSCNDICRLCAYRQSKRYAIFATAPSMDGFASDTTPITKNNFKITYQAKQPEIIMADTKILAAAPTELKSAGFGDMVAKYIGLADWKISTLLTGEYYCEKIAKITEEGLSRIVSLADKITSNDEETAGQVFEALVFTGLAMGFAKCSRPASGTEHIVSHFWEVKKLDEGLLSDYHGKKVGVATLFINKLYQKIAKIKEVDPHKENVDWGEIKKAYGKNLQDDMMKMNNPTVTDEVSPEKIKENWDEIRKIITDTLPTNEEMLNLLKKAGAATTISEISVSETLLKDGLKYHPFMRHRITLARLIPMIFGNNFDYSDIYN